MEKRWKVVMLTSGCCQDFEHGFESEEDAWEFVVDMDYFYMDENGFEWRLDVREEFVRFLPEDDYD